MRFMSSNPPGFVVEEGSWKVGVEGSGGEVLGGSVCVIDYRVEFL